MFRKLITKSILLCVLFLVFITGVAYACPIKTIYAKALDDYDCSTEEWHFVITGVKHIIPPEFVTVVWDNEETESVLLDKVTGNIAHYRTAINSNVGLKEVSAEIAVDWNGQFNVSHGFCSPTGVTLVSFSVHNQTIWEKFLSWFIR